MLAEEVKERIQSSYRQLLEFRDLTPRYGQRQMIAEIAKTLSVLADNEPAEPRSVSLRQVRVPARRSLTCSR